MNIETKFNVKDVVFFMHESKVLRASVEDIYISIRTLKFSRDITESKLYSLGGVINRSFTEDELFLEKKDLLAAL